MPFSVKKFKFHCHQTLKKTSRKCRMSHVNTAWRNLFEHSQCYVHVGNKNEQLSMKIQNK